MVEREQIISFLRSHGPSVPNDIKRSLGGDTMIFGAMLSELITRGSVKITKVKKGSSPFYYVPGQEKQLEKLDEFCNPKDQKTIALLKDKQVLRDKSLELFERVSLRQVPDFAKELKVNTAQGEMLFWKYYLLSDTEAIDILKKQYNKPQAQAVPRPAEPAQEVQQEVPAKPVEAPKEISKEIPQEKKPEPVPKQEVVKKQESVPQKEQTQQKLATPSDFTPTEFYEQITDYFSGADITVLSSNQIAKNREYEFTIIVPSSLGSMEMYCRARNKKKLNEGDVAPALLKAKIKDLPCIFLTNGEFTKKSLELIKKEYKGIIIKKLS